MVGTRTEEAIKGKGCDCGLGSAGRCSDETLENWLVNDDEARNLGRPRSEMSPVEIR